MASYTAFLKAGIQSVEQWSRSSSNVLKRLVQLAESSRATEPAGSNTTTSSHLSFFHLGSYAPEARPEKRPIRELEVSRMGRAYLAQSSNHQLQTARAETEALVWPWVPPWENVPKEQVKKS